MKRPYAAKYITMGCPGFSYEDVCENPYECAEVGICRRVRESIERRRANYQTPVSAPDGDD